MALVTPSFEGFLKITRYIPSWIVPMKTGSVTKCSFCKWLKVSLFVRETSIYVNGDSLWLSRFLEWWPSPVTEECSAFVAAIARIEKLWLQLAVTDMFNSKRNASPWVPGKIFRLRPGFEFQQIPRTFYDLTYRKVKLYATYGVWNDLVTLWTWGFRG